MPGRRGLLKGPAAYKRVKETGEGGARGGAGSPDARGGWGGWAWCPARRGQGPDTYAAGHPRRHADRQRHAQSTAHT